MLTGGEDPKSHHAQGGIIRLCPPVTHFLPGICFKFKQPSLNSYNTYCPPTSITSLHIHRVSVSSVNVIATTCPSEGALAKMLYNKEPTRSRAY